MMRRNDWTFPITRKIIESKSLVDTSVACENDDVDHNETSQRERESARRKVRHTREQIRQNGG
jgi:hypothetical protein